MLYGIVRNIPKYPVDLYGDIPSLDYRQLCEDVIRVDFSPSKEGVAKVLFHRIVEAGEALFSIALLCELSVWEKGDTEVEILSSNCLLVGSAQFRLKNEQI